MSLVPPSWAHVEIGWAAAEGTARDARCAHLLFLEIGRKVGPREGIAAVVGLLEMGVAPDVARRAALSVEFA